MSDKKMLQVEVEQIPGTIHWNFDDLKNYLTDKMNDYKGLIYTEDTVKEAQKDVADLRKLRKSVEDKRKEIKARCMEPYNIIEKQAKELVELIDEPIKAISEQVDDYEMKRREAKKEEILSYMDKAFVGIDQSIVKKLELNTYDEHWENKTCAKKTWTDAIDQVAETTKNDIAIINGLDEEFVQPCMDEYRKNLILNEAMQKAQELRKQKELILERERQRQEAIQRQKESEAKRKAEAEIEKARADERAKVVAERRAQEEAEAAAESVSSDETNTYRGDELKPVTEAPIVRDISQPVEGFDEDEIACQDSTDVLYGDKIAVDRPEANEKWIRFRGNDAQYQKVIGFIRYIGAEIVEVVEDDSNRG